MLKLNFHKANFYHYTPYYNVENILKSDILLGSEVEGDIYKGVSLTRDPSLNFNKCRITLNASKMDQDGYVIKPFDFFVSEVEAIKEKYDSKSNPTEKEQLKHFQNITKHRRSEVEEVLVGDLKNIHKYILAIDIFKEELHSYVEIIEAIQQYKEKYHLNFEAAVVGSKGRKLPREIGTGNLPSRFKKYEQHLHEYIPINKKVSYDEIKQFEKYIKEQFINLDTIAIASLKRDLADKSSGLEYRIKRFLPKAEESMPKVLPDNFKRLYKMLDYVKFVVGRPEISSLAYDIVGNLTVYRHMMNLSVEEKKAFIQKLKYVYERLYRYVNKVVADIEETEDTFHAPPPEGFSAVMAGFGMPSRSFLK